MDTQGKGFYDKEKGVYYPPKKAWYKAAFSSLRENLDMILLVAIYASLATGIWHAEGWLFWTLLVVTVVLFQNTFFFSLATGFFVLNGAWRMVSEVLWGFNKVLEVTGVEKVLNKVGIEIEKKHG